MNLGRTLHLLLVEDNEADVHVIREGLSGTALDYTLDIAEDGQAAIEYLNQRPDTDRPLPDIVLLDLNMPRKSGTEVLVEMKSDSRIRRIPVLVLTSSQSEADVWAAYDHGANSYLRKPGTLEEIYDLMRAIEHYWAALSVLPGPGQFGMPS